MDELYVFDPDGKLIKFGQESHPDGYELRVALS